MDKKCPCGKALTEVVPNVWICANKKYPHLWQGVPGRMLSSSVSEGKTLQLAQKILDLETAK